MKKSFFIILTCAGFLFAERPTTPISSDERREEVTQDLSQPVFVDSDANPKNIRSASYKQAPRIFLFASGLAIGKDEILNGGGFSFRKNSYSIDASVNFADSLERLHYLGITNYSISISRALHINHLKKGPYASIGAGIGHMHLNAFSEDVYTTSLIIPVRLGLEYKYFFADIGVSYYVPINDGGTAEVRFGLGF